MRNWDKSMLRFPPGMKEQIKQAAKENGRSMNSEIIQRLKESLKATSRDKTLSSTPAVAPAEAGVVSPIRLKKGAQQWEV
jgi:hypothetical protein